MSTRLNPEATWHNMVHAGTNTVAIRCVHGATSWYPPGVAPQWHSPPANQCLLATWGAHSHYFKPFNCWTQHKTRHSRELGKIEIELFIWTLQAMGKRKVKLGLSMPPKKAMTPNLPDDEPSSPVRRTSRQPRSGKGCGASQNCTFVYCKHSLSVYRGEGGKCQNYTLVHCKYRFRVHRSIWGKSELYICIL